MFDKCFNSLNCIPQANFNIPLFFFVFLTDEFYNMDTLATLKNRLRSLNYKYKIKPCDIYFEHIFFKQNILQKDICLP